MTQPGFDVDPETLRLAMRRWATGVTVVSTELKGIRHGMTVSSFTSVSLTPPQLLVSLENLTRTFGLVRQSGIFGISILSASQQPVSDRFAGRETEHMDRFVGLPSYTLSTGAPLLGECLASFDCRVVAMHPAGTHTLVIGQVVACRIAAEPDPDPLIYFNRDYRWIKGA